MPLDLAKLKLALPADYGADSTLGTGGQGAVFLGTFRGERVALKVFTASADSRRVERELNLLQAIDCQNLVKLRADTTLTLDGTSCFLLAYEYLDGGDLQGLTTPGGPPIDPKTLATIGAHVARAIEALWSRRIVHRDIKPANIVKAGKRFVLVDVGLARHLDLSTLTMPGMAAGTLGYMSPEQAQGRKNLTIHSDVFSLGVTLYEIAARQHPFGRSQGNIGRVPACPLRDLRPDFPLPLCSLIQQMLSVPAHMRPSSVADKMVPFGGA